MSSSAEHSSVADETVSYSVVDERIRKIFIGGLNQETDSDKLSEYFSSYGDIDNVDVKIDKSTGNSRCFGFVVFKTPNAVQKVMDIDSHVIDGKKVDVQKPKAKQGKIFVGGLDERVSEEDIKAYFSTYGTVVEVQRPYDNAKQQKKGFCFVVFDNQTAVHTALKQPKQTVNGKELDVKSANPRTDQRGTQRMFSGYADDRNQGIVYPMQGWCSGYQVPNYNNSDRGSVNVPVQLMRGKCAGRGSLSGRERYQPY